MTTCAEPGCDRAPDDFLHTTTPEACADCKGPNDHHPFKGEPVMAFVALSGDCCHPTMVAVASTEQGAWDAGARAKAEELAEETWWDDDEDLNAQIEYSFNRVYVQSVPWAG